ncbi:hypothetical protein [Flavobacterium sp.]
MFCTQLKITQEGKIVFCIDTNNYHTHHFDVITSEAKREVRFLLI